MIKLISTVILVGAALLFLNRQKIQDYKQSIVEVVNPAAKEKRLLGELENSLGELGALFNEQSVKSGKTALLDQQKISSSLGNIQNTLRELKDTNQQIDLGANLSNLIQKIIPLNSNPSPTWLPPSQTCPTP